MGKKKRSRSRRSKGGFFKNIKAIIGYIGIAFVKLLPTAAILGVLLGIFFGVREVLCADSQLQIKNVMVNPPLSLTAEQRKSIELRYLGKNLLLVDLNKIARELENDPEIRQAKVVRKFPSLLNITVEKRVPFSYVRFDDKGQFGVISDDGMILDVISKPQSGILIIDFFSIDKKNLRVGYQIKQKGLGRVVIFVKRYWSHPLSQVHPLTKISLDHLGSAIAEFSGPPAIRIGRFPDERFDGIEKALHILESSDRTKIDYIDLQYDNVIVKNKR